MMAIRRSQVGFYTNIPSSKTLSRGSYSTSNLTQFVEGIIDVYHTFITKRDTLHQDDSFFYLKGGSFTSMFTHDKEGVRSSESFHS